MSKEDLGLALPKKNYYYVIAGVVVVLLGFVLMSGGGSEDPLVFDKDELFSHRRITLAPFLVILGYVIVLWGILKRPEEQVIEKSAGASNDSTEKKKSDDDLA